MTYQPYFDEAACQLAAFDALVSQTLNPDDLRFTKRVEKNVPFYDVGALGGVLDDPLQRRALLGEWGWVLSQSSGALVLKGAVPDPGVIAEATRVYMEIIAEEAAGGAGGADHFAAAGSNARIWNSAQKLCLRAPEVFARYFASPAIAGVCEAWLGPGYQMTAQVNLVRPGGKAQQPHRDFHLGFQTNEAAQRFPAHVHDLSPVMTLQGAVAHCDMPVESGPTKLLPFSQTYRPGYIAYRLEPFRAFFEERCIQLPLETGDALFFSPALFHGAGDNVSADIQRMANLLQVSSPFGRAMEALDRSAMSKALYPALQLLGLGDAERDAAIAACAEGYSFPTNLDTDPPVGGLAPETQAALMTRALESGLSPDVFNAELDEQDAKRCP